MRIINKPNKVFYFVITSYSIHYTKLYERSTVSGICVAVSCRPPVKKIIITVPQIPEEWKRFVWPNTKAIYNLLRSLGSFDVTFGTTMLAKECTVPSRITSYNVCYTKLLRSGDQRSEHPSQYDAAYHKS